MKRIKLSVMEYYGLVFKFSLVSCGDDDHKMIITE